MIKKLLCIDDDQTTLMLIKLVIEKASFAKEVILKSSGQAAMDYYIELSKKPVIDDYPELIFLDLNMPVLSGWEFLEEFITNYYSTMPNTKVLILSSSTNPVDKEKAKLYPIILGYISKPITVDLLKKLIN